MSRLRTVHLILPAVVLATACQDTTTPVPPAAPVARSSHAPQDVQGWFDVMAREGLALPGTVLADYDETTNRVLVGVEHAAAAASVRGLAARLGVPASALEVREMEPIVQMATLRDKFDPRVGGIQIHFGNFLCTLGFNAVDAAENSFITNSHCTKRQGGVQSTAYYQPTSTVDGASIATEVEDPDYQRNLPNCPRGKKCRHSDSARARYNPGISSQLGRIAQPTGLNDGSLTFAGFLDFTAEDLRSAFPTGLMMRKVGRTTGMTEGAVTATCAVVNVSGTNITQLCQTIVEKAGTTIVGGGDSGSPVYTGTALAGILWGGTASGTLFVFSPLTNIKQELGSLTTR